MKLHLSYCISPVLIALTWCDYYLPGFYVDWLIALVATLLLFVMVFSVVFVPPGEIHPSLFGAVMFLLWVFSLALTAWPIPFIVVLFIVWALFAEEHRLNVKANK